MCGIATLDNKCKIGLGNKFRCGNRPLGKEVNRSMSTTNGMKAMMRDGHLSARSQVR